MDSKQDMSTIKEKKAMLSTLWIFLLFNVVYADILSLMDPASPIRNIMAGAPLPSGGLLAGAILMEVFIVMVILSRILPYKANRWTNIIVGALIIIPIITGGHGQYYVFFASIEVLSLLLIIWYAWKLPKYKILDY